jgi:hypothetical protein
LGVRGIAARGIWRPACRHDGIAPSHDVPRERKELPKDHGKAVNDFAKKLLPSGGKLWRNGPLLAMLILAGQSAVGLLAVGAVLKRRDIR